MSQWRIEIKHFCNIKIGDCFEFNGITYLNLGYKKDDGWYAVFDLINNLMDGVGCGAEVMPINATLVIE